MVGCGRPRLEWGTRSHRHGRSLPLADDELDGAAVASVEEPPDIRILRSSIGEFIDFFAKIYVVNFAIGGTGSGKRDLETDTEDETADNGTGSRTTSKDLATPWVWTCPHARQGCKSTFQRPDRLRLHLELHSAFCPAPDKELWECLEAGCGSSFADETRLKSHIRNVHNDNLGLRLWPLGTKLTRGPGCYVSHHMQIESHPPPPPPLP